MPTVIVTYLGFIPTEFFCANQPDEGLDLQLAWHCAVCHVAQADFRTLFPPSFIVKSSALLILLVVDIVR